MKRKMYITISILAVVAIIAIAVLSHPAFGSLPSGERMERIRQSANYKDGAFQNLEVTPATTSDENIIVQLWNFVFNRPKNTTPPTAIEAVKTNLHELDLNTNQIVWLGHSSYIIVADGKTILVDPVLTSEFPASLMMTPFKGTDLYTPADIPAVDVLLITHDHWDHLDYGTLKQLNNRVKKVIAPLGVGAHLEKWGFADRLTELDWHDSLAEDSIKFTCLPTRHFSGRLLKRGQSLWASYMLETKEATLFVGGDSGFGKHFADIAELFPSIDLAILEVGQYDKGWSKIHAMPDEQADIINTLNPKTVLPVHNSKFALANHEWDEPRKLMQEIATTDTLHNILLPKIGEVVTISTKTANL